MISITPTMYTLMIEALAVLSSFLAGGVIYFIRRGKQERLAVKQLIADIKRTSQEPPVELLAAVRGFGIDANELTSVVEDIDKRKRRLYQVFIDAFMKHDIGVLPRFRDCTENLVQGYQGLLAKVQDKVRHALENGQVDIGPDQRDQIILRMSMDYERVKQELGVVTRVMDKMLNEYNDLLAATNNGNAQTAPEAASESGSVNHSAKPFKREPTEDELHEFSFGASDSDKKTAQHHPDFIKK